MLCLFKKIVFFKFFLSYLYQEQLKKILETRRFRNLQEKFNFQVKCKYSFVECKRILQRMSQDRYKLSWVFFCKDALSKWTVYMWKKENKQADSTSVMTYIYQPRSEFDLLTYYFLRWVMICSWYNSLSNPLSRLVGWSIWRVGNFSILIWKKA